jgi:hypothetical protein
LSKLTSEWVEESGKIGWHPQSKKKILRRRKRAHRTKKKQKGKGKATVKKWAICPNTTGLSKTQVLAEKVGRIAQRNEGKGALVGAAGNNRKRNVRKKSCRVYTKIWAMKNESTQRHKKGTAPRRSNEQVEKKKKYKYSKQTMGDERSNKFKKSDEKA